MPALKELKTQGLAARIQTAKSGEQLDVDLVQLQIENKKLKNRLFILKKVSLWAPMCLSLRISCLLFPC